MRQRHSGQTSTVRRSDCSISSTGTGSGSAALTPTPRLVDDLVATALDLTLELVDEQVGGGLVRRRRLAAVEIRPLHVQLGLDEMVVGDLRVALAVEDDFDERLVVEAAPELRELRLDVAPDTVVHVPVPHRDLQSHRASCSRSLPRYRTARARQTTSTRRAPARRSTRAQADAVAPVV